MIVVPGVSSVPPKILPTIIEDAPAAAAEEAPVVEASSEEIPATEEAPAADDAPAAE